MESLNIKKEWVYNINNQIKAINIENSWKIILIDSLFEENSQKYIKVDWDSFVDYKLAVNWKSNFDIQFDIDHDWQVKTELMTLSKNNHKINWNLSFNVLSSKVSCQTNSISLCENNWDINLNISVHMAFGAYDSIWSIQQKNIFLADKWKINITPKLYVACNDVKANHWVSISKFDEFKSFYLMSKWLSYKTYKELLINWYIQTIFWDIEDKNFQNKLLEYIL